MVKIQPSDIDVADNVPVIQRRIEERVPLLTSGFREPSLRHLWMGIRRSSWYLVIYVAFFLAYLALGAMVFGSMEQPVERQLRLEIRRRIDSFLYNFPSVPGLEISIYFKFIKVLKKE